jgi:hypothetical protein
MSRLLCKEEPPLSISYWEVLYNQGISRPQSCIRNSLVTDMCWWQWDYCNSEYIKKRLIAPSSRGITSFVPKGRASIIFTYIWPDSSRYRIIDIWISIVLLNGPDPLLLLLVPFEYQCQYNSALLGSAWISQSYLTRYCHYTPLLYSANPSLYFAIIVSVLTLL